MQAIILAGGKGTRIADVASDIPKPMIPVLGKPIIEHQVRSLVHYGVRDIIMITGYLSQVVEDYFGDGSQFGANIRYFIETVPLGTAGGIKMIEESLDEHFFVLYGDIMMDVDYVRMMDFHRVKNSQCTLAIHPNNHPYDSDLVEIDKDGLVIAFHAKPHSPNFEYHNLVNAALYIFSRRVVDYLVRETKADFGKDIFPKIVHTIRMFGYITPEYMKDIGTPNRLKKVECEFAEGLPARLRLDANRKAIFLDRDGVLNREVKLLCSRDQLEVLPGVPEAVSMINRSDYLAVVVTNQPVVARNLCSLAEIDAIHKRLETRLGEKGAWLDAIEFCPHHPDGGFPEENKEFKIVCNCRKPKTGMIEKMAQRFNIHMEQSWIIGDSERDIECGRRSGLHTVGVRTGDGCRDVTQQPDYMFDNLFDAVSFIVHNPYDQYWSQISQALSDSPQSPSLILIAGQSRSGKSIFARWLENKLAYSGKNVINISMDLWLIPESERNKSMTVFDRYNCNKMEHDLERLLCGERVVLKGYNSATRERLNIPISLSFRGAEYVILDGVVALHNADLRSKAVLSVVINTERDILHKRFESFYAWKGLKGQEIASLLKQRQLDEQLLVEVDYAAADMVINSPCNGNMEI